MNCPVCKVEMQLNQWGTFFYHKFEKKQGCPITSIPNLPPPEELQQQKEAA